MLKLTVDIAEPLQIEEIVNWYLPAIRQSLRGTGFCDYLFTDVNDALHTVERKTVQDLSGRVDDLEGQLSRACSTAQYVYLIVEGVMTPADLGKNTMLWQQKRDGTLFFPGRLANHPYKYYLGFLLRLEQAGIPVIATADMGGTAEVLVEMVKLANDPNPSRLFQRYIRRKTIPQKDQQVQTLVNLGLGEQKAQALIKRFGTAWAVLNAPKFDFTSVPDVGIGTYQRLYNLLGRG